MPLKGFQYRGGPAPLDARHGCLSAWARLVWHPGVGGISGYRWCCATTSDLALSMIDTDSLDGNILCTYILTIPAPKPKIRDVDLVVKSSFVPPHWLPNLEITVTQYSQAKTQAGHVSSKKIFLAGLACPALPLAIPRQQQLRRPLAGSQACLGRSYLTVHESLQQGRLWFPSLTAPRTKDVRTSLTAVADTDCFGPCPACSQAPCWPDFTPGAPALPRTNRIRPGRIPEI